MSDETGAYLLSGVPEGDHVVEHVRPRGYRAVSPEGAAVPVSVTAGARATADFSDTRKSLLHGTAFHDLTGNRALDAGESGLAGLLVFLDLNRNNLADVGEPTALTDADGRYSFLVDRGRYRVGEVLPAGWQSNRDGTFQVRVGTGRVIARDFANRPT